MSDPNQKIIVQARGLVRTYEDSGVPVQALRGVDLDIARGDFTCIAGPSGSGKTTLLNLLGGLDLPTAGSVAIEGTLLGNLTRTQRAELRLRRIGFVFQAYNLIPVLSAAENVEYVLLLQKVPPARRRERIMEVLGALDMKEYADRRPNELSGGQQQRVAVARALAADPAIILLDEPTANLDSENGGKLLDYLERSNRDRGTTFLFCSHDPMVIDRAHRLIRLRDGRIEEDRRR
jgi:putative ABC transport system ATP-binding protein